LKFEVQVQSLPVSRLITTAACVALWVSVLLVRTGAGFNPTAAPQDSPPAARSTMTGVYTAEQATAGEKTYGNVCTGCHNLGSHSGPSFSHKWKGKPLFELYEQISEKMPEDDPGSLTPAESAQIVAYLLKANGSPAGTQPLPTDAAELRKILIETK
jgi:mono/diheme cytochrome c family protein